MVADEGPGVVNLEVVEVHANCSAVNQSAIFDAGYIWKHVLLSHTWHRTGFCTVLPIFSGIPHLENMTVPRTVQLKGNDFQ